MVKWTIYNVSKHLYNPKFYTINLQHYSFSHSFVLCLNICSVFAGTAVIVNYVLMVTWLPACIVVSERVCWPPLPSFRAVLHIPQHSFSILNDKFLSSVVQLKYIWLCSLGLAALACVNVVFYWPRLRLPDSPDFQLFSSSHPFEQYESVFKDSFWFERPQKVNKSLCFYLLLKNIH